MPSSCCPPTSLPPLPQSSTPDGTNVALEGVDGSDSLSVYATCSPSPIHVRRAVVVFSDVYGRDTSHHKRFCHQLAAKLGRDTCVAMPDFFRGSPLLQPLSFLPQSLGDFLGQPGMLYRMKFHARSETVVERDCARVVIPWLRAEGVEVFACAGFCWGSWAVGKSLGLAAKPFACGVGMHPVWGIVEKVFGRSLGDMAEAVGTTPCLLMPAGDDDAGVKPGGEAVRILARARSVEDSAVSVSFPDMKHGWVNRGDREVDEKIARDQDIALNLCSDFILEHASIPTTGGSGSTMPMP